MACRINATIVRRGLTNFLDKQLSGSEIFEKRGSSYIAKPRQSYAAEQFVNGLNRRFSENVIEKSGRSYSIRIPDTLLEQYIDSTPEGKELTTTRDMYINFAIPEESLNYNTTFSALNYPEISEFTYNNLISFLKSINPDFRVEEVDNLSQEGITHVKDFLIQVKTLSKFSALPEEAAHVFIELMKDDNPLKQEAINNVTSFPIYSQTLAQYRDIYTLQDGNPDYEKIKREAVAKLLSEYVTALSTEDNSRIASLTKSKQGWLARWFAKLLQWLGLGMRDNTQIYIDLAGAMLSGENTQDLKDAASVSFTDSYFYRLSEKQLYDNVFNILDNKPPNLLNIISKFSKEFGKQFNEILKDEKFAELNEMLKRNGEDIGKINRLSEIKIILGEAGIDLKAAVDSSSYITGIKQFLEAVDRLDILSDSILKVIRSKEKSKTFDEAIQNIKELEGYFSIYETFNNIISAELAQALIDSNVAADIIESIQRTQLGFKNVNDHILSRLRNDLFIFYKTMLQESNDAASQILAEDLERFKDNSKAAKLFQGRMDKLITTEQDIIKMLSGKGRDIDNFSSLNHLTNASYANGDVFLSSITKYVQDRIERAQLKGAVEIRSLYQRIDPIVKQLGEDAVTTGKKITFSDIVYDRDTGEFREVLTWLNPHKNIQPALDEHRRSMRDAAVARSEADPNSEEFKKVDEQFKKAQEDYLNFIEKYYNRPFVKEYYTFRKKYENDTDFITIMAKWKEMSEQIRGNEGVLNAEPENDELWEQLSRMKRERSNLLNETDLEGNPKSESDLKQVRILKAFFEEQGKFREEDEVQTERTYGIYRNRYEQKLDFALSEVRKDNPSTIEEVEQKLQQLMKSPRLRIVTMYNSLAEVDNIDYDIVKDIIMADWYDKNVKIYKNEEFFKFQEDVIKELNELQNKGELTGVDLELKLAHDRIYGILFGSRNEMGEINPASLSQDEKDEIVFLEGFISDLKLEGPGRPINTEDFSDKDKIEYERLTKIINDKTLPSGDRRKALRKRSDIINQYKGSGKNKVISDLINILGGITRKVPTTYYWDKLSTFIHHVAEFGKEALESELNKKDEADVKTFVDAFIEAIDFEDYDTLDFIIFESGMMEEFLDWLKVEKPEEYNWFVDNHSRKRIFDHKNGTYTKMPIKYARSAVYNFAEPTLEEHKKIMYNRKFRKYRVKDEYRTGYNPDTKKVELKVGEHITNREYNGFPEFLPLLPEQGAPTDSPYRNDDYYKLRDADPIRFQYLTELRNMDLLMQEKTPPRLRRWNQVPVISLTNIEEIDPAHLKDVAEEKWDYVKSIFKKESKLASTGAEAEAAARGEDTVKEIDQFTQTTIQQRIPKLGMSQKVDIERVSRNVLRSTVQFILRAHEFEGRTEAEPVVRALLRVMKDNEFKSQMSNKERAKKFESIYSQMILQEVPETTLNTKSVRRIARILTTNTSYRMLADPIGGIINYGSAMVNNIIEASAGRYLNLQDLAKGKVLAFRVNTSLMADYNKKANLSVHTLMFQTFDFIQGDFEDDLLDRSSSKDKHASVRQMLMIPRKAGELMAQTAVAMGILERHKIKNSIDGRLYPAHEIYTKDQSGNSLKLKEGFPEEYNPVDGEKFLKLKRLINRVNFELHGNYAKLTQTEASRYAIGKLAENMKRWFMPAFQRRFGRETIDLNLEDPLNEGYYRTSARAARNVFGSLFRLDFGGAKDWMSVFLKTPRYKHNLARMAAEASQALLLFLIFSVVLGYSGDDDKDKLKQNSWIHNTAILLAIRIYSETTAYIPFPPFGFQEMKRNVTTPFTLPADAISNFAAIGQLGLYQLFYWMGADSLEKQLYYSKDSGFWYSEKGDSKILKYLLRSIGYTGISGLGPDGFDTEQVAAYIKNFENVQNRLK